MPTTLRAVFLVLATVGRIASQGSATKNEVEKRLQNWTITLELAIIIISKDAKEIEKVIAARFQRLES